MKPAYGPGIVLNVPLPNMPLVAAGMSHAQPPPRKVLRMVMAGWQALLLGFGLGGVTCLVVLARLLFS